MRFLSARAILSTVALALLAGAAVAAAPGDDLLARAAARLREKNYTEAVQLAGRAADSPQRSLLLGVASLRAGRTEEALPLLAAAGTGLPLAADYAALYQAEALMKLGRHPQAAARTGGFAKEFPSSLLIRRAEKLHADILFESGDHAAALKAYQGFVEKYPSGSDSVEALFQSARCREAVADPGGAAQVYRNIWLNNPAAPQAKKSGERIAELDKKGSRVAEYTPEELLKRASALSALNDYSGSLQVLKTIPREGVSAGLAARIDLRSGLNQYRLRNWKQAEKSLTSAAGSTLTGIRSEARFWLAKSLERQEQNDRAYTLYLELAGEGRKQEYADDALMEAGGLRRSLGAYQDAAAAYDRVAKVNPESKFLPRAYWEAGWCRYLGGEHARAAESFKPLLKDEQHREKALYWLGRSLERTAAADAEGYYRTLLDEYPAGFYATWHRGRKGIPDQREPLGARTALNELPQLPGYDKPRLLASLGLMEEARAEMAAARKKAGDKKGLFPGLARIYLELQEYGSAIALFLQNRPVKWDKASLPLWTAGYPLAYGETVAQHAAGNGLSEGLVYALIRAESGFAPTIKSPAGAIGLMQLMPATAKQTAREKGEFNPARLTVPEYNIKLGTRHLRDLLQDYKGEEVYAIAAYNAGAAAVDRWRKGMKGVALDEFVESIPYQETRDYVKKVYASSATYRRLYELK